jgi:hypothetical protein
MSEEEHNLVEVEPGQGVTIEAIGAERWSGSGTT